MPQCSYCNRKVAYDAKICPGCGKEKPAEDSGCVGIIVIFFLIGLLGKCSDNSTPVSNSNQNQITTISSPSHFQSNQSNQSSQWEIER
jgi:hypothetical protein